MRYEKQPFRPKRELKGRYYTWSELAPYVIAHSRDGVNLYDEDVEPTPEAITNGSAFGQLYGKAMHAFVEKIMIQLYGKGRKVFGCREDEMQTFLIGWQQFWIKELRKSSVTIKSSALGEYISKGHQRGVRDIKKYIETCLKHSFAFPTKIEIPLENIRIKGSSLYLTAKIDQLHPAKEPGIQGSQCIIDLKFDNCTREEFVLNKASDYFLQLKVYALVYRNVPPNKRRKLEIGGPKEVAVALWHVPTGCILFRRFTDEEIAKTRNLLKIIEKKYKEIRTQERNLRNEVKVQVPVYTQLNVFT